MKTSDNMVEGKMKSPCLKHISVAIELAEKMIQMSDHGVGTCDSDYCLLVYGVIRDCAYKIRGVAKHESQAIKGQNILDQK